MRGQRHASAAPYPRERTGTNYTGGCVGLRAGLDWCGKSRPTGIRSPDRPARRQSLYRLRYPALLNQCSDVIPLPARLPHPFSILLLFHSVRTARNNGSLYSYRVTTLNCMIPSILCTNTTANHKNSILLLIRTTRL